MKCLKCCIQFPTASTKNTLNGRNSEIVIQGFLN